MTNGSLMKVKGIAKCSLLSILQYFRPALSDNWFSIFGLFYTDNKGEHSGSVVECLTRDRVAAGLSLTCVTALCPCARTLILA